MARQYTVQETNKECNKAINNSPLYFYQQAFLNRTGLTKKDVNGNQETYTEVIAKRVLYKKNWSRIVKKLIKYRKRTKSFDMEHGVNVSGDGERRLAKAILNTKNPQIFGQFIGYETPLKKQGSDKIGKIDLLAFNKGKNILRLIELKDLDSPETLLRCVMEIYSYYKLVDIVKLKNDFKLDENATIKLCVLVYLGGEQWRERQKSRPNLEKLIKFIAEEEKVDIEFVYYNKDNSGYQFYDEINPENVEIKERYPSFADRIKAQMAKYNALVDKKTINEGIMREEYPHIYKNVKDGFLCNFKFEESTKAFESILKSEYNISIKRKLHPYATSMNSSQVMCINFFYKFFEEEKNQKVLLNLLAKKLNVKNNSEITFAAFEYKGNNLDNTSFDFYMKLNDNIIITFETKYTEPRFGTTSNGNWGKYLQYVKNTNLKNYINGNVYNMLTNKKEFFNHYQINRNIIFDGDNHQHLADNKRFVVFLTPKANESLKNGIKYINDLLDNHIVNLCWEDVIDCILNEPTIEPELWQYYNKFKEKYIDIL